MTKETVPREEAHIRQAFTGARGRPSERAALGQVASVTPLCCWEERMGTAKGGGTETSYRLVQWPRRQTGTAGFVQREAGQRTGSHQCVFPSHPVTSALNFLSW